jgi:hypothetical protein
VPRAPTLASKSPSALFAGDETGCGALGRRDRESRFLTAFFVFPGKFFTVRRLKKRLEYQSRVPIKIPQRDRNPRNSCSRDRNENVLYIVGVLFSTQHLSITFVRVRYE